MCGLVCLICGGSGGGGGGRKCQETTHPSSTWLRRGSLKGMGRGKKGKTSTKRKILIAI